MRTNGTLDPLVTALAVLRKIYNASSVNDYGDIIIGDHEYPEYFSELLNEIGKIERVIAASLQQNNLERDK